MQRTIIRAFPLHPFNIFLPSNLLYYFLSSHCPLLSTHNTNTPIATKPPKTAYCTLPTFTVLAAPVKGAKGAPLAFALALAGLTALADHVAPSATLAVVAPPSAVTVLVAVVASAETMLAGGQLEMEPMGARDVVYTGDIIEEDDLAGLATGARDTVDRTTDDVDRGDECEYVLAYQTELGIGTSVIVTTEATDEDTVTVDDVPSAPQDP